MKHLVIIIISLIITLQQSLFGQSKGYSTPEEAIKAGILKDLADYVSRSGLKDDDLNKAIDIFMKQDQPEIVFANSKELSNAGFAIGDYGLGWCYEGGEGTAFDQNNAFKFFQKAANAAIPFDLAYRSLGYHYSNGDGVGKDLTQAFKWFSKGADSITMDQYRSDCLRCMANMLLNGEGVNQNEEEAFRLYCESAQLFPQPRAAYMAGMMKLKGIGTEKNEEQALIWIEKAAKLRHPKAQFIYGVFLIHEKGNITEGEKWVMDAAINGDTDAMMYIQQKEQ